MATAPSATCNDPLLLQPLFEERVWGIPSGSDALAVLSAAPPQTRGPIGEIWLTGGNNRVANGPHAGLTLQQLAAACAPSLLGDRIASHPSGHPSGTPVFPLLVKFLFTTDKLSVQVHPPDSYARERENSWGKTEMWHVLQAAHGAHLAIGFRDDLPETAFAPAELRAAMQSGAIEQMLHWIPACPGDTFYVPAGTVHAIGGGLTLCEIQQNSDVTYRLYDYNRPGADGSPRALHIDHALAVARRHTAGGPTAPLQLPDAAPQLPFSRTLLAACPYFATERCTLSQGFDYTPQGRPEIWVWLEGSAEVHSQAGQLVCRKGQAMVIPAAAAPLRVQPLSSAVFLRVYPPRLQQDILAPLRSAGISSSVPDLSSSVNDERLRRVCFFSPDETSEANVMALHSRPVSS